MSSPNAVDSMYRNTSDLIDTLVASQELSFASMVEETFRKTLVLAAASNFEDRIICAIEGMVRNCSNNTTEVFQFTRKTGIERKYFTYFQWSGNNVNSFFALFGPDRLDSLKSKLAGDDDLVASSKIFLQLGYLRNNIAHNNFAEFPCDKTVAEVYSMYKTANKFVEFIEFELASINGEPL